MSDDELRRSSPVPLYFQLQEILKEKIEDGIWGVGEMIPSEPDLCVTFRVSRTVVRQALSVLEQDGQLRRVQGRGTFVSASKIQQRVGGISRLLASPQPGHQVVVLDYQEESPPARISEQLKLSPEMKILRMMALLRFEESPVALFDSFFPLEAVEPWREQLPKTAPFELVPDFRTRQPHLVGSNVAIETSFCSTWEADQLQIPLRGAVFVTLCTEFSDNSHDGMRPVEVSRGVYRVDRVQLRFDVEAT